MSKSPSLRRIQADIRELAKDPSDRYHAAPLEDDMFEWHFTIRGADGTEFEGGIYHGRILLPPEYPFKPPHIIFLTPSGRFETNTKVCLSFSAYHPELWQPAWGIRLILEALISFLPSPADGAIGALDYTKEERKKLAIKSRQFVCPKCGKVEDLLPPLNKKKEDICDNDDDASGVNKKKKANKFDKEIQKLFQLQSANAAADREGTKKRAPPAETDSKATTGNNEGQTSPSIHEESSKDDVIDAKEEETNSEKSNDEEQSNMKVDNIETSDTKTNVPEESSHDDKTPPSPAVVEIEPTEATTLADTTSTPVAAVQDTSTETNETVTSWTDSITDPVLNGSIVTFAIIVFLLFRKVDSLLSELRSLQLDMD